MKKVMFVVLIMMLLLAMAIPAFAAPAEKVDVCHLTSSETNEWVVISINDNAWETHDNHGDQKIGVDVDGNCEPLPTCPVNPYNEAAPGVDWSGCSLTYANLSSVDLSGANLTNANLTGAGLSFANLSFVNLTNANLTYADLLLADLPGANLTGANLTYADLSGAYLSGAVWSNTTCPDGSNSDAGACT